MCDYIYIQQDNITLCKLDRLSQIKMEMSNVYATLFLLLMVFLQPNVPIPLIIITRINSQNIVNVAFLIKPS